MANNERESVVPLEYQRLESLENLELSPEEVQGRIEAHMKPLETSRFPAPLTLRNSRVPSSNGFVKPQGNANSTNNIRARTFEENFIRRLMVNIDDSFKDGEDKLDFKRYQTRLQAPDCSREEAIFLYDELIAILLMLILYVCYVTSELSMAGKPSVKSVKLTKLYDSQKFRNLISGIFFTGTMGVAAIPATLLLVLGGAISGGTISAAVLLGILGIVLCVPLFGLSIFIAENPELDNEKNNLAFTLQYILNTILDNRNTIPAISVKRELKYWGLTQAQVDYIFSNNIPSPEVFNLPEIPAVGTYGIENENEREKLVQARQAQIDLYNYSIEHNEGFGFKLFGLNQIIEFIQLVKVNPEELAPNEPFSLDLVKADNLLKLNNKNIPRLVRQLGQTPNQTGQNGQVGGARGSRKRNKSTKNTKHIKNKRKTHKNTRRTKRN
jgi:hypothetical protein